MSLFFLLNGAENAFGMHACPHHDLVVQSGGAEHGMAGHEMASHKMAGHEMEGMGDHSNHSQPGHSGPCTCQGVCQMTAAAALPEPPVAVPTATIAVVPVAPLRAEHLLARRRAPFFLPYAQAPPRVS